MPTQPGRSRQRLAAGLLMILLLVLAAAPVFAHAGGPEEVIVFGDHVDRGATFRVVGSGIEPGVDVAARVVAGATTFALGSVAVAADGSFDVMLTLPREVPTGYAQLILAQPSQGDAGTTFLVGPRAEGGAAAEATGAGLPDERTAALLVLVATLVGISGVGFLVLRGQTARRR